MSHPAPEFENERPDFEVVEEPEAPHDERWLVSYADMMTLLFGFFVLLYAMSDKIDVIQKSANAQFGKSPQGAEAQDTDAATKAPALEAMQEERGKMLVRVKELELEVARLRAQQNAPAATGDTGETEKLKSLVESLNQQLKKQRTAANAPKPTGNEAYHEAIGTSSSNRGSGNAPKTYTVIAELPGGGQFKSRLLSITLSGIVTEETPPEILGDKFRLNLRRDADGSFIEVSVYSDPGSGGQRSNRLSILGFTGDGENTLRQWFEQKSD